jgi:hypothetical protein
MKDFREEILRRRNERRSRRSSSWLGFIAKILLLAFVLVMIRFFGKPSTSMRTITPPNSVNTSIDTTK